MVVELHEIAMYLFWKTLDHLASFAYSPIVMVEELLETLYYS